MAANMRRLYEAGAPMVVGNDAGIAPIKAARCGPVRAGHAARAGVRPRRGAAAVTSVAARVIGLGHRKRRIAPGFDADILAASSKITRRIFTRALPAEKLQQMPLFLAEMSRGISRRHLGLDPYVCEVLDVLRECYPLAIITDAQSSYAHGELHKVGMLGYFDPIIVSGDHGYRKPDRRLFQFALDGMGVAARNALYVGNDMYRDIYGAREAGLTTVMVDSDQGAKAYRDCASDHTITGFRHVLEILGLPRP